MVEETEDSTGQKITEYEGIARNEYVEAIKNNSENYAFFSFAKKYSFNAAIDLLGMEEDEDSPPPKKEKKIENGDVGDLMTDASTTSEKSMGGIQRNPNAKNIVIPYSVLPPCFASLSILLNFFSLLCQIRKKVRTDWHLGSPSRLLSKESSTKSTCTLRSLTDLPTHTTYLSL